MGAGGSFEPWKEKGHRDPTFYLPRGSDWLLKGPLNGSGGSVGGSRGPGWEFLACWGLPGGSAKLELGHWKPQFALVAVAWAETKRVIGFTELVCARYGVGVSEVKVKVTQSCPTLCDPMDSPWNFPTQGSNSGLPRCRWILYHEPPGKPFNNKYVSFFIRKVKLFIVGKKLKDRHRKRSLWRKPRKELSES